MPPAAWHAVGESVTQPPVAVKQHGQMFCVQLLALQVVPSPPNTPPCAAHRLLARTWQVPLGRQHAPGTSHCCGVQLTRMTQSPLGRQTAGSCAKLRHPPGQPSAPQSTAYSQLLVEDESPPTSVVGNALALLGGATMQGFCVWLLWWSMR